MIAEGGGQQKQSENSKPQHNQYTCGDPETMSEQ